MRKLGRRAGRTTVTTGAPETFNANADSNELGVHTTVGYCVTADYNFDSYWARRILAELDPFFRPLWVNILHRSPNGGFVWTGHHMLARYVPITRAQIAPIRNFLPPTSAVHGIRYENPIIEADLLDGLTDSERDLGVLPRYQPFTGERFRQMQYARWVLRNKTFKQRRRERQELREQQELEARRANENREKARAIERNFLVKRHTDMVDRVYVSDTLKQLRETAGFSPMEASA